MKKLTLLVLGAIFWCIGFVHAKEGPWVPNTKFLIENTDYRQTLGFISGMSYALTASNEALKKQNKSNFICIPDSRVLGSRFLIEILNAKLSGRVASETVVATVMEGLSERFPCE